MAKVATRGPVSSNALQFGGGPSKVGTAAKRKTPSELRGEQLKRKNVVEIVDEYPVPEIGLRKATAAVISGLKKTDLSKNPRYVETRMDGVYPIRKNIIRMRALSRKDNVKESSPLEHTGGPKGCAVASDVAAEGQQQLPHLDNCLASTAVSEDGLMPACKTTEKCGENKFRSVTELSAGAENIFGMESVDLDKALKELVAHQPPPFSSTGIASEKVGNFALGSLCSEFHIPARRTPLDFTLKTTIRVVSPCSVNWFHRLINRATYSGVPQFPCTLLTGCSGGQKMSSLYKGASTQFAKPRALHSWVYPQSSLPPSVISALTLSGAEGVQMDFLSKRQLAWEDAFRCLYFMLRNRVCDIFYVCTSQFVVLFIGNGGLKESKRACNAYMSRSTRSLRSLLRMNNLLTWIKVALDIQFSMPLCYSKVEQITAEDLVELSEIEKHNLGQIHRQGSMLDVDNSPQSLLAFSGHDNIHGLYDFLLNYRFNITSLSGVDVPVLYSPVPFQNAALSSPEVKCKAMKTADNICYPVKDVNAQDVPNQSSLAGFGYGIEIKDAYLPPWVVCSVCEALDSEGISFEASFVTESASVGLNVGLETIFQKCPQPVDEGLQEISCAFGIPNITFSSQMCSAFLKALKYSDGSYTAAISPV
ncbi:hypothetical protein NMG60_11008681 [Bertholletia excelsa]